MKTSWTDDKLINGQMDRLKDTHTDSTDGCMDRPGARKGSTGMGKSRQGLAELNEA